MKTILFTSFLLLSFQNLFSQSADEIWSGVLKHYRNISNYVDEGILINYFPGNPPISTMDSFYIAMDSHKNVDHWIYRSTGHQGYQYNKTSSQEEGTLTRLFEIKETVPRSLDMAAASLYAVGGGILDMTACLMHPNFYGDTKIHPGPAIAYDTLIRLQDTTISNVKYYQLELIHSIYLSEEKIRYQKHVLDSIHTVQNITVSEESDQQEKPGTRTIITKYFVSTKDGLIHRREQLNISGGTNGMKTILTMNPKSDVPDFKIYLEKKHE
ncbi:MAG: hypothetical protein ABJC12_03135 [Saprospiraceae bacterium]